MRYHGPSLALALTLAAGCGSVDATGAGPDPALVAQLRESRARWEALAAPAGDSYVYVRLDVRPELPRDATLVEMRGGVPATRSFKSWIPKLDGLNDKILAQWSEHWEQVGAHPEGYPAQRLGALYDECERDVLGRDPADYEVRLALDGAGLLRSCLSFSRSCAGRCGRGVLLESVRVTPPG